MSHDSSWSRSNVELLSLDDLKLLSDIIQLAKETKSDYL